MITVAFCLEVFLFALAAGVFVVHEARKGRMHAAAENRRERVEPAETRTRPRPPTSAIVNAADTAPLASTRPRRVLRGVHS
ncbi:MAG: hypothetical protein ACRDQ2_08100 [Gaiellales bacterium]